MIIYPDLLIGRLNTPRLWHHAYAYREEIVHTFAIEPALQRLKTDYRFPVSTMRDVLMQQTGYSRSAFYADLKAGEDVWWKINHRMVENRPQKWVELFGPDRVATNLGLSAPERKYEVPREEMRRGMAFWRDMGAVVWTIRLDRYGDPRRRSRVSLRASTGVPETTQRYRERHGVAAYRGGVNCPPEWAIWNAAWDPNELHEILHSWFQELQDKYIRNGWFIRWKYILRQLPKLYEPLGHFVKRRFVKRNDRCSAPTLPTSSDFPNPRIRYTKYLSLPMRRESIVVVTYPDKKFKRVYMKGALTASKYCDQIELRKYGYIPR